MIPTPPPGQGPIDPRGAFVPPPPPGAAAGGPPAGPGSMGPGGPQAMYVMPPGPPVGGGPMPTWPMPYPPRRRGGPWWWIAIVVLLLLLIGSLIANAILAEGLVTGNGGNQTVLSAGDAHQIVAVIPLVGIIDSDLEQHFGEMLDRAEQDTDVKALVVRIDTPGGEVGASDEIYHRIEHFKQIRKIPVVISMGSLATSGGYYVSSAGDYLFAEETTDTGNIGVLMPGFNFSKLLNSYGITDQTTVSSGTPYKEVGSPFIPPTQMGSEYLQHLVDGAFDRFKEVVKAGRGARLRQSIDTIANGKVYLAKEAQTLGLVDDIGYLTDATQYAATAAKLSSPQVVRYEEPTGLLKSLLLGSTAVSPAQSRGGPGSVEVNLNGSTLDRLLSPRMMYLWRP
jgi:protease-4